MNPIFSWIVAHTAGKGLAATCPKCGRKVLIKKEQKGQVVKCEGCGTEIPPPKTR